MAKLTICDLPDEVHRALRVRAARHGRSIEAEVRTILEDTVLPTGRVRLGSLLTTIGRRVGLSEEEFATFVQRDTAPGRPLSLD